MIYTDKAIYSEFDEKREHPYIEIEGDQLYYDNSSGEYSSTPIPALKVAALCLRGQSFGFSPSDVATLKELFDEWQPRNEAEADGLGGRLHSLIQRMEALVSA